MSRYSYDCLKQCFLDGEDKMKMPEVVHLLNKDLRNVTYRYSVFDECITENYEPISVNKVLDLLNGEDNDFEVTCFDKDYVNRIKELEAENKKFKEFFNDLMENAFNLLKDDKGGL